LILDLDNLSTPHDPAHVAFASTPGTEAGAATTDPDRTDSVARAAANQSGPWSGTADIAFEENGQEKKRKSIERGCLM
jgi:hypothetical protein